MRHLALFALVFSGLNTVSAQSVPPTYQDIYDSLDTQISAFNTALNSVWNGSTYPSTYAPQLIAADSSQYTGLLAPYYYSNVVQPQLQEIQAMGAKSVTVHISFPILYEPFYGSNTAQYQQFLSFYQQLAQDIRSRGMGLIVETGTSTPFPGNMASSFTNFMKSLSWNSYMAGRAQNALVVAQQIQPDYMSVITEPDTEETNSGQTNMGTVSGATQLLTTILTTLQSAGVTNLSIGAGAGTWIKSFSDYVTSFAGTSIQYIDFHVYPINKNDFTNLLSAADTAHSMGKQVAISEAWVYKVRDSELGKLSIQTLYGRDPFSFWAPVDTAFLQSLANYANAKQLIFLSPFWSHYLFAYLDYGTWGTKSSRQVLNESYTEANVANLAGQFTSTGLAWTGMTVSGKDTSPPVVPSMPSASSVFPSSVVLAWPATTDDRGVAAYKLYRNGTLLDTTSMLTYNDQNLTPGVTYNYTLSAFDEAGNESSQSTALSVETTDTTPPTVPTQVKVTGTTSNSVSLSWKASTDTGGVGGYWILRGTSPSSMSIHGSSTTTSYSDPFCSPDTQYYYSVESYNLLYIASNPSSTVQATTNPRN